jgi:alanyl-tRNA synthetase
MDSRELRQKFLDYFKKRGHTIVPSSSLLPNDPSVLLTTAGMQQFKPYFVGYADPQKDFGGLSTASIQKSFRTSDIDEVGDETHLTFFEMMGNFSFGGYFKEEAIKLAWEFLSPLLSKERGKGGEVYATVFGGDDLVPKDEESRRIWESLGISDIREAGREDNFWGPTGNEGPCGPTTEIYINDVEIWNIVFNEYYCQADGTLEPLKTPGVDTGMGLERLAMCTQGKQNIFETDLFAPLMEMLPDDMGARTKRIVSDHARGVVFLLSDGVLPSNKEAGYILRRLMRRMLVYEHLFGNKYDSQELFTKVVVDYSYFYKELNPNVIKSEFAKEKDKFQKSIARGLKELARIDVIDAFSAFRLYESFGLPYEIVKELGGEKAGNLAREDFDKEFEKHREASRAGREKKFGGHGLLLDTGELKAANEEELKIVTRLHTATHLLQAALREVLGEKVHQEGSDITAERLRFDFSFDRKLTDGELKQIGDLVNDVIGKNFDMGYKEMSYKEAIKTGALYFEKEKYPVTVRVYSAVDPKSGEVFSRELCGGPHVSHTAELGHFKIIKEESVGAGVRRIRAIVE